jgi:hypothetical protein
MGLRGDGGDVPGKLSLDRLADSRRRLGFVDHRRSIFWWKRINA